MAAVVNEKTRTPSVEKDLYDDEKHHGHIPDVAVLESDIQALGADIEEALQQASNLTEEDVADAARTILSDVSTSPSQPKLEHL